MMYDEVVGVPLLALVNVAVSSVIRHLCSDIVSCRQTITK